LRYPLTKTVTLLVTVAILLVALGGGFSYLGYNNSLQALTVTKTIPYSTTTHTLTFASTTSEWTVVTAKTETRISGPTVTVNPHLYAGCAVWVGYPLDAPGAWHVSYTSDAPIDFWLDNEEDWWNLLIQYDKNPPSSCAYPPPSGLIVSKLDSTSYEFFTDALPAGRYAFVFRTRGGADVRLSFVIEAVYATRLMELQRHTVYSFSQEVLTLASRSTVKSPAELGSMFFAGFAILVAGIALTTVVAAAKTMSAPSVASTELCRQCGARIPRGSKFCDKCGTAALRDQ
jgi:ribosomal protein L40E